MRRGDSCFLLEKREFLEMQRPHSTHKRKLSRMDLSSFSMDGRVHEFFRFVVGKGSAAVGLLTGVSAASPAFSTDLTTCSVMKFRTGPATGLLVPER